MVHFIKVTASREESGIESCLFVLQVVDHLCGFLPNQDLLNCRGVNRQWNSSCVNRLHRRGILLRCFWQYGKISKFTTSGVTDYKKFLESREEAEFEMFPNKPGDVKYSFEFSAYEGEAKSAVELESAKWLKAKFSPNCIHSLEIRFGMVPPAVLPHCSGYGLQKPEEFSSHIEELLQDVPLDTLRISIERSTNHLLGGNCLDLGAHHFQGLGAMPETFIECVTRIVNAPASIKHLNLTPIVSMGENEETEIGRAHV